MPAGAHPTPRWLRRGLALAGAAATLVLSGCAGDAAAPAPNGQANPNLPDSVKVFQRKCEEGVNAWRESQITYPRTLSVPLGDSVPYQATVDIRDNPPPAAQEIDAPGTTTTTQRLFVRCRLAARLTSLGESVSVRSEADSESGWVYQEFTPSGVVTWTWDVSAREPDDTRLRLDVRPSMQLGEVAAYSSASIVSFETPVTVEAGWIERLGYWFQTQWPWIVTITAPLGAAIVGLISWVQRMRDVTRKPPPPPRRAV